MSLLLPTDDAFPPDETDGTAEFEQSDSATSLPVLLTVEDWVEYFADWGFTTAGELQTALSRVGGGDGPALVADLYFLDEGHPDDVLARVICSVWSGAEYPDAALGDVIWRRLFKKAGFTVDGRSEELPPRPLTLWRGSVPERRADWSWTDRRDVAATYADGAYGRPPGRVWQAEVEPSRLLARNTERGEHEYVVDTLGLTIREAPDQADAPIERSTR